MCGVIHISVEGNLVCIAGKRTENTAILWSTPLWNGDSIHWHNYHSNVDIHVKAHVKYLVLVKSN